MPLYGIDMYNNTEKSYRKIYRKSDQDRAYSEEFLLIRQGLLWLDFLFENLHFSNYYNIIVGELKGGNLKNTWRETKRDGS